MGSNHPPSGFPYSNCFQYHLPRGVDTVHGIGVAPRSAMHDAMWRQMEKNRIREQIIHEEIARRRMVEEQVRRELMVGMNMGMQIRSGVSVYTANFNFVNMDRKGFTGVESPRMMDGIRFGESSGVATLVRHQFGRQVTLPQMGADTWTSQFGTPVDSVKEKQKVILQAKPRAKISGMKRKFEVLPPVRVSELTSSADAPIKKKVKEEWACALCEVSATSEQALKEHQQGKRHKAKEAGLRKNGKNFSIGLLPKKNLLTSKLLKIPSLPSSQKGVIPTEINSANTETNKRREPNFKFWCELCQVGTFSETVMETHRKGKKHVRLLKQNTVDKPSTQIRQTKQEMNLTEKAVEDGDDIQSKGLGEL